jgi:hypothetical protein
MFHQYVSHYEGKPDGLNSAIKDTECKPDGLNPPSKMPMEETN